MTQPYGYLPAPKGLPELDIEPFTLSKSDIEYMEMNKYFDLLICKNIFGAFDIRLDETIPPGTIIATDGKTAIRIDGIE